MTTSKIFTESEDAKTHEFHIGIHSGDIGKRWLRKFEGKYGPRPKMELLRLAAFDEALRNGIEPRRDAVCRIGEDTAGGPLPAYTTVTLSW